MDAPEADAGGRMASRSGALVQKARHRLRNIGAAVASVAAVGAVVGGLTGYWNAWQAVQTSLHDGKNSPQTLGVLEAPTVAVAQVVNETGDASLRGFSDGLTQQIAADLAKFGTLRILSDGVVAHVRSGEKGGVPRQPGVDYSVDGDVRRGADLNRVTIRLVNAKTGDRIWTRSFDARPGNDNYLSAQDEIAGRTAVFLGSWIGAIASDQYRQIVAKPLANLTPYECIVQGIMVSRSALAETYTRGRGCLEALVAREPANGRAWAALASVYSAQRLSGVGLPAEQAANIDRRGDLVHKAFAAALKAVALAPDDSYAHRQLSFAYALRCDREMLAAEGRKAIDLNPNDPAAYGTLGIWTALLGDWEHGAELAQRAIDMTAPATTPTYWMAIATRHFMRGEFPQAYEAGTKYHNENDWVSHLERAAGHEANGRHSEAQSELATALKLNPGATIRVLDARQRAMCIDPRINERFESFLRKVGLPE